MPPYHLTALVLWKNKLAETDLIVTLLSEDGSQVRAVAKGARKPASAFAARLEPFTTVDLLVHTGRGALDIISEARIVSSHAGCRSDPDRFALCTVMTELLVKTTFQGETDPVLYPLSCAAFDALDRCDGAHVPFICAAHILKVLAVLGVRPILDACALCGNPLPPLLEVPQTAFSYREGGRICDTCRGQVVGGLDAVDASVLSWVQALIGATFAQIAAMDIGDGGAGSDDLAHALMRFCEAWTKTHLDLRLKSLESCFRSRTV